VGNPNGEAEEGALLTNLTYLPHSATLEVSHMCL